MDPAAVGIIAVVAAPVAGLLGALIGAGASTVNALVAEGDKRRRDAQAVAVAVAAGIETTIWMTERRGHVATFEWMLQQARLGQPTYVLGAVDEKRMTDPIADKLVDRIGVLEADLATRSYRFFSVTYGLRTDILNLREGRLGTDPAFIAHVLEQDLDLWRETEADGKQLVIDLRAVAARRKWRNRL